MRKAANWGTARQAGAIKSALLRHSLGQTRGAGGPARCPAKSTREGWGVARTRMRQAGATAFRWWAQHTREQAEYK